MVALSASRFVWSAIAVMSRTTLPISSLDSARLTTVVSVRPAASTAVAATCAACVALREISRIDVSISCEPDATVRTFVETPAAAVVTSPACREARSEAAATAVDTCVSSSLALVSAAVVVVMSRTSAATRSAASLRARAICPASSCESAGTRTVRSPSARRCSAPRTACRRRMMPPETNQASVPPATSATSAVAIVSQRLRVSVARTCASRSSTWACTAARRSSSAPATTKYASQRSPCQVASPSSRRPSRHAAKIFWSAST